MSTIHLDSGTIVANGSTAAVDADTYTREREGYTTVYATGTWDSGVITIQISPDGTNWFSIATTLSANGFHTFANVFSFIRLTTASIASAADIDYWIK